MDRADAVSETVAVFSPNLGNLLATLYADFFLMGEVILRAYLDDEILGF